MAAERNGNKSRDRRGGLPKGMGSRARKGHSAPRAPNAHVWGGTVDEKTSCILIGCGESGRNILEKINGSLSRDFRRVLVNSQNMNLEELEGYIRDNDMVFLACGVTAYDEIIAAGVISELCRTNSIPVIGIALMPASGAVMGSYSPDNVSILRRYVPNLIILDHSNIIQTFPGTGEEIALDVTHQLIGKLIDETADLIDTISLFNLEDVWSYRDR